MTLLRIAADVMNFTELAILGQLQRSRAALPEDALRMVLGVAVEGAIEAVVCETADLAKAAGCAPEAG